MPDRDLDITKFSYGCYRKLKKTLGEFDAVVECNEIAIREFLEHAKKDDAKKYIQQLSKKHKVRIDEIDFWKLSSRIRQYYIVSVYQQSEQYFDNFKEEWKRYNKGIKWDDKRDGETKLQYILRNTSLVLPSDLIDIYNYYRLIRNYMSHTERDLLSIRNGLKKIKQNPNDFLNDLHLTKLPNSLENINYDDFILSTNIVKHIAYLLSTSSKPNNAIIAEILFEKSKENNGRTYKGLKKLKNDIVRYEKALKSFISVSFGRFSTNDSTDVMNRLKALLA